MKASARALIRHLVRNGTKRYETIARKSIFYANWSGNALTLELRSGARWKIYERDLSSYATEWNSLPESDRRITHRFESARRERSYMVALLNAVFGHQHRPEAHDIGDDQQWELQNPAKRERLVTSFIRNDKIRDLVRERARGRCELCKQLGFETDNGRYLECHHIVQLGVGGADSFENVVALCANCHRKAHFGTDLERINSQCQVAISGLLKSKSTSG